jgi:hypothetical protein
LRPFQTGWTVPLRKIRKKEGKSSKTNYVVIDEPALSEMNDVKMLVRPK